MNKRGSGISNVPNKKVGIADEIEKLRQRREDRKSKNDDDKGGKNTNNNNGSTCDPVYENMIKKKKLQFNQPPENHMSSENAKLFVLVRKRPLSKKEIANAEIDNVSTINPRIYIHECKTKVDGITKYIEDHEFYFDNAFSDRETTEDVYSFSIFPTINLILNKGLVTCFAYGQTGSGKTFTMKGIQNLAIDSLFKATNNSGKNFEFYVSFFEIYGGRLYDLLNGKNKLQVLEDKNQKVQIFGLEEKLATSPDEMRCIIELANSIRTTHNTVTNETSSRSHAICNIILKEQGSEDQYGKLTLVDLAGSERAQETQSNDRQRRAEGAEINKSLLALKECIRALDARKSGNDTHVPFRASKLTLVLRDSFVSKSDKSKIIMIACISPAFTSANHTINTLRYSDRLKEKTSQASKAGGAIAVAVGVNNNSNVNVVNNNQNLQNNQNYQNNNNMNLNYNNYNPNNAVMNNMNYNNYNMNNNNNNNYNNNQFNNNQFNNNNNQFNNNNQYNNQFNNNLFNNNNQYNNQFNNNNQYNNQMMPQQMYQINQNNNNNNKNPLLNNKRQLENNPNPNNYINNNVNLKDNKLKEIDDINMHVFNLKDDNINDIDFDDRLNCDDRFLTPEKQDGDDWEYLKKTVTKEGKYLSDDFIRYHQITDQIVEDEDNIINTHMNIIKDDAKMLTEEGELITNIKGIGDEEDFKMDEYTARLEKIINKKIALYTDLKKKMELYKLHIKEEDELKSRINPKFFIEDDI